MTTIDDEIAAVKEDIAELAASEYDWHFAVECHPEGSAGRVIGRKALRRLAALRSVLTRLEGLAAPVGKDSLHTEADPQQPSKEQSHREFYEAFHAWFMQGSCDFWSECDAPEELATIAVELSDRFAAQRVTAAEAKARREAIEECAIIADERSAWAESKIGDENAGLRANYCIACDDCAELIRALSPAPQNTDAEIRGD